MAFGKALTSFGSGLTAGPLGVVQIGFEGYDLGKTVDAATLKPDLDVKDIMYQQNGSKAKDHVITGADWILAGSFGEINTELLKIIAPYLVASSGSAGSDSGYFKADLYESLLDTVAGVVKVASVTQQVPSTDVEDTMYFYLGIPIINGDLINWGADVQRNLPFEFRLKPKTMTPAESTTVPIAYGYWGDPTVEDLPAAVWPDLDAPYVVSSVVASATSVTLTLSENATEISGVTSTEQIVVKVNNQFVAPTVVGYATNVITLTLPASSITSGDTVETSIGAGTFEDAESNPNEYVDSYPAVNSL
jgi:hypothetical protein